MMSEALAKWFAEYKNSSSYKTQLERPIAYFSAEYAVNDELPIYAGGLGILAGDYLREAADQEIPLIAVGLYYSEGFIRKELSPEGKVVEAHEPKRAEEAGLTPVVDEKGVRVTVCVPIQDREVNIRAWLLTIGKVKLYLLDTRLDSNSPSDQHITDKLYTTEKETRLKQEMVLGIGGLRMLEALKYHPSFYHLNEGHSAFLAYELIRHEMKEHGYDFAKALEIAKSKMLFTNHTLVAAGNDVYSNDLVSLHLEKFAEQMPAPVQQLVSMGLVQQSSTFSMTILAMRCAGKINAVSKLHATKAKDIWADHPMTPITNGIHVPTWDKVKVDNLIWDKHVENKRILLNYITEKTGVMWDDKPLIVGWGRRIVRYKRPLALVERLKRFGEIARNEQRPLRVVFAGLSHPADIDGGEILEELRYRLTSDLKGVAVYLPHYNMELSAKMVAGCDVWLNTPVVGYEACGTSGMKAALNGNLPLSTRDGWVAEIETLGVGWAVEDTEVTDSILDRLEQDILPLYYDLDVEGKPAKWITMMRNAREMIMNDFAMSRALKQYLELISS